MKIPKILQKNDRIGILSTARAISEQELQPAVNWLSDKGLHYFLGETISLKYHQFAGTDAQRIADIQAMISNPDIKAIWCARGGYGTARLLDFIDFSPLLTAPKWIMGYSDVTALHSHLNTLGVASLHCTMPINITENTSEALLSLENFLFGKEIKYQWENEISYPSTEIQGEIVGGNLSVIYSLLGSKSSICSDGKILFLEDLDEYLYHIDRMMLNLKRNGLLSNLKAILVGSFTKMHDNSIAFGQTAEQIIKTHCQQYNYPIIFNAPMGHIADNRALVLGKEVKLSLRGKMVSLEF